MNATSEKVSGGIDVTVPSIARVYDYYLGGKDNFAADRDFAERLTADVPDAPRMLRANRDFLGRVVTYLAAECGVTQFLDIGSGLPTQDNVHQVAQRQAPGARVVYVDNDPIVLVHSRALLKAGGTTGFVRGDLREPAAILASSEVERMIDFAEPVALLLLTTLFFVSDEFAPNELVRTLTARLAPGSYLVISHAESRPQIQRAGTAFRQEATEPGVPRTRDAIAGFFEGFDLVEPGLVPVTEWQPVRPQTDAETVWLYGGVARKPAY